MEKFGASKQASKEDQAGRRSGWTEWKMRAAIMPHALRRTKAQSDGEVEGR